MVLYKSPCPSTWKVLSFKITDRRETYLQRSPTENQWRRSTYQGSLTHPPIYSNEPDGIVLCCLTHWIHCLYVQEWQDLRPCGSSSKVVPTKGHPWGPLPRRRCGKRNRPTWERRRSCTNRWGDTCREDRRKGKEDFYGQSNRNEISGVKLH